ncbi:MAG: GNAT family N-acetyltransferase [Solobacterium sp.]|nr:GNAT family N-acetyltransferase [Solobacterium sp.]
MRIEVLRFEQLSNYQLYDLLKLRSDIFVVEQNCVYGDMDGRDISAVHVLLYDRDVLQAYLRVFLHEDGTVRLGRVVSRTRGKGYGQAVLKHGIRTAEELFDAEEIVIEAQVYAAGFYGMQGFRIDSEEFLEDGIPHVRMVRRKAELPD